MTETEMRQAIIDRAKQWIGRKEADGTHKVIIDTYNKITPLPRGYRMSYTDPWCAAFVSAVGYAENLTSIILPECACDPMIALYRAQGRWMETDSYIPKMGDIIMYDWEDSGVGDNMGSADHVGIVESCNGSTIVVIEGNISDSVGRRNISVNAKFIRGYCLPKYGGITTPTVSTAASSIKTSTLVEKGDENPEYGDISVYVAMLQGALKYRGFDPGIIDGEFGPNTKMALLRFKTSNKLTADSKCDEKTWEALRG